MREGKVASLILTLLLSVIVTTAATAVVAYDGFHQWSQSSTLALRFLVLGLFFATVFVVVLFPLGIMFDRSILGIPAENIPRLFDKFYRIKQYKRAAKGSGLGLSLCKHIVETLHDGQIGVESQLGKGSKFWVSIPIRSLKLKTAA